MISENEWNNGVRETPFNRKMVVSEELNSLRAHKMLVIELIRMSVINHLANDCINNICEPLTATMADKIKEVIFNKPATIIYWKDGTKTVVKAQKGDKYYKELGFAMAVCKKVFGNKGNFNEVFKKWGAED